MRFLLTSAETYWDRTGSLKEKRFEWQACEARCRIQARNVLSEGGSLAMHVAIRLSNCSSASVLQIILLSRQIAFLSV